MASRAEAVRQKQQAILAQVGKPDYSGQLLGQIALAIGNEDGWQREYPFHGERRWRLDLANFTHKLAVEVEGVVMPKRGDYRVGGRHASVKGFTSDCEKYAALAIAGWRLIRVMPKHVTSGQALLWIEAALGSTHDESSRGHSTAMQARQRGTDSSLQRDRSGRTIRAADDHGGC